MKLVKSIFSCTAPEIVVMTFPGRNLSLGEQVTILVGFVQTIANLQTSFLFSSKCLNYINYLKMDFNFDDELISLTFQPDNYECL